MFEYLNYSSVIIILILIKMYFFFINIISYKSNTSEYLNELLIREQFVTVRLYW